MKVKATQIGYYNFKRQYPGAAFILKKDEDFSETWMEQLEGSQPKKIAKKVAKKSTKKASKKETVSKEESDSSKPVI